MKKVLFFAAAFAATTVTFGQDLTSKKGEAYLPAEGDYAIGIDAVPVFNMLKFNSAATISAASPSEYNAWTIYGKRFKSATLAERFTVSLSTLNNTVTTTVTDLTDTSATPGTVEDVAKTGSFNLAVSYGHEHRRGNTRVQGIWGYEGMISLNSNKTTFETGNALDSASVGFTNYNGRESEFKSGMGLGISVRAFVGAEYFIAPKLSLGFEYGVALGFTTSGNPSNSSLQPNDAGTALEAKEATAGVTSTSSFNLQSMQGGSVKLLFHF
jgi:hypothetical protein